MRFAGSQLDLDLHEFSPEDNCRFAGAAAKENPELVDRIKATISLDVPESDEYNESNY